MEIIAHQQADVKVAEVASEKVFIRTAEDGVDLLGNIYFQGFDRVIIHEKHIAPEFFNLKTGIAGEILQKFSNYRVRLAIVGDFEKYTAKSIRDFIFESNKTGHVNFVGSVSEALDRLS